MSHGSLERAVSIREAYKHDVSKYKDISNLKTETIDYKNETQL